MANFISRLFKRREKTAYNILDAGVSANQIPSSYGWNWWQQGLGAAKGDSRTAIVNSIGDAYGQTPASIPAYHYKYDKNDTKEKVTTSALSRVLYQPNSYQTRSDFFYNAIKNLMLKGNSYILATRNDRNEIVEMHQLANSSVEPYVDPDNNQIFYAVTDNPLVRGAAGVTMMVPQRDICHIRLYTPNHPLVGVSPIENAAMAIAANAQISAHQAAFFANQSRPSGILSTDMKLTKEQMLQLRGAYEEQAKHMNTGGIPILGNGIKWEPMSLSNNDSQLIEAFNMTVEDVARAFRIPLPLVNDNRHSTYNNVEQLISHWLSGGLGFVIDHVENNLDRFFNLPIGQKVEFDTDQLLRTDFSTRIDGYTKAIQAGLMAPNEARSKFSGLKKVKHGDKPIVQQQMVPLGWTENQPAPVAEPVVVDEPATLTDEEQRGANVHYLKRALNG